MLILFILTLTIATFWLLMFLVTTDWRVPSATLHGISRAVCIFPHPDDESLTVGALTRRLRAAGAEVTLIILTKGEKGTPDGRANLKLSQVRSSELSTSAKRLGFSHLELCNFPDGGLPRAKKKLESSLRRLLEELEPDLIVTYDRTGLYGHPDHIVCSEVVTKLAKKRTSTRLWYATLPEKVIKLLKLPEHMATDPQFKQHRTQPTTKVWVLEHTLARIYALYAHASQRTSFKKSMPIQLLPLWFYLSALQTEYFHEANE